MLSHTLMYHELLTLFGIVFALFTIIVVNIVFMSLTGNVDKMMMNAIILIDVCND